MKPSSETRIDEPRVQDEHEAIDPMEQIKQYVAELKDPDRDRSFTSDLLLVEYEAFAEQFLRTIQSYREEPYSDLYPQRVAGDKKMLAALNRSMIKALENHTKMIRGESL